MNNLKGFHPLLQGSKVGEGTLTKELKHIPEEADEETQPDTSDNLEQTENQGAAAPVPKKKETSIKGGAGVEFGSKNQSNYKFNFPPNVSNVPPRLSYQFPNVTSQQTMSNAYSSNFPPLLMRIRLLIINHWFRLRECLIYMGIHRRLGPTDFSMERIVDKLAMKEELPDIIKFSINNDWDLKGHNTNLKPKQFGSGICLGTDEWSKLVLILKKMESMKKELAKRMEDTEAIPALPVPIEFIEGTHALTIKIIKMIKRCHADFLKRKIAEIAYSIRLITNIIHHGLKTSINKIGIRQSLVKKVYKTLHLKVCIKTEITVLTRIFQQCIETFNQPIGGEINLSPCLINEWVKDWRLAKRISNNKEVHIVTRYLGGDQMVSTNVEGDGTASRDVKIAPAPLLEPAKSGSHGGRSISTTDGGSHEGRSISTTDGGSHGGQSISTTDGGSHGGRSISTTDGGHMEVGVYQRQMVDHMETGVYQRQMMDHMEEQYYRRTSLRFNNVPIPAGRINRGKLVYPVDTDSIILDICNNKLRLDRGIRDIGRSHVIGDMYLILVLVLETLTLVDSYTGCSCPCLEADVPVNGDPLLSLKNGMCENRRIKRDCPYICNVGYTGDCCQTPVDTRACRDQRNHCQNGGTYISASTCLYSDGYTGRICETNRRISVGSKKTTAYNSIYVVEINEY
ncbi:unnamed protein product [Mytilus coruscus]|uniref:EGF-like domain-containing protein n=1 Tax=Mytilus coruscus TaxID=42192 RepID=A0A6J8ABI2_MYTCO|nr:unnamed protein product [Mytilus coruscus]